MPDPTLNEALSHTNFTTIDWVIVIVYPLISLLIGIFVRKFVKNMKDFVAAGRGLGLCLGIATMTGTELGLITVMYSAQKGFTGGFAAFHIALVAGFMTFLVGVTGFFIYRLRTMKVLTIPEFYERRFDRKTRVLGGIMMAFGGILNMGLFLKVGSMFIVGVTGMTEHPLALKLVMTFLISLVLIYTCLGGMVSVVIADYVQFVVLSFGLVITCILAIDKLGWDEIWTTVQTTMGRSGFDPTVSGGGFGPDYMIWMGFIGLISCAVWPTAVARALAMKSPKAAQRQYMFSAVSFLIRFLIPYFWGICAFVFIMGHETGLRELFFPAGYPPPKTLPGGVAAVDNLYAMPVFLGRLLPPVMIGVISAGMVAAFMSTHDSYLLCWSSVLTQDVCAPLMGERLTPRRRILLTRFFIVVIGLWVLFWGLFYEASDDIWDYMAITGAIYTTGAFAVLLGGLYWKRSSSTGAFTALLAGTGAILGLGRLRTALEGFLRRVLDWPALELTSARVGLAAVVFSIVVLVVFSLLFPDRKARDSRPLGAQEAGSEGVEA